MTKLMDSSEFIRMRKSLNRTQIKIAYLLGISCKAVKSYEQGWRNIPVSVERQLLFLLFKSHAKTKENKNCWEIMNCPKERYQRCPAWEFNSGDFCWFINGTICRGEILQNWKEKMKICRQCDILKPILEGQMSNS